MAKSDRLRLSDVESCFDLIDQCRELWADPNGWRQHLLRGVCKLTGQAVGHYIEMGPSSLGDAPFQFSAMADCGWRDDDARSYFLRYSQDMTGPRRIPFPGLEKIFAQLAATGRSIMSRQEACSDTDWYRSPLLNEYRLPAFNDGYIMSFIVHAPTGRFSHLGVHQDSSDAAPTAHAKRMLDLVHRRLVPLLDTALASEQHRSRRGLTPRLGQTLDRLLGGDTEKQIAARLDVSRPTAHEYIGKVYRHFNVKSHAELMAYFLQRRPRH